MSVDTIGNFLTSIRNAVSRAKRKMVVPYSNMKFEIASVLKKEGFVQDIRIEGEDKKELVVFLKYVQNESPIHEIKQISKPGRRIYVQNSCIPVVIGGLGIAIITTNKGVITNKQAKELGVGGEVICTVW